MKSIVTSPGGLAQDTTAAAPASDEQSPLGGSAQLVRRAAVRPLDTLFAPQSVAVIGASEREGSVGRTVLSNLLTNPFGGCVYPVNAKRKSVLGVAAYRDVASLPERPDLAVIVTPAPTVPAIIDQCAEQQIPSAIIISAGFKELGPEGVALERQIQATARRSGMRIVGPNCLGVISPISGLNASFAGAMARRGKIAFLSQSGALCTAILDWSLEQNVGFSAFVSLGTMLDVGWGDLVDYFGRDPGTESILMYMETVGDARSFLSAARNVALDKPIVAIKGGRTQEASQAAASHTGSLAGSDMAFDAAAARVGVLRVDRIAELFSIADVLSKQPRPKGNRLTIVTNAGGPAVLATDALVEGGGRLATLDEQAMAELNSFLPPHWSRGNPIDVLGDADAGRYARTLETAGRDPNSDGLLVVLTPQDMTDPLKTAQALGSLARIKDKPVLAGWMGGPSVEKAVQTLADASIPNFAYPDAAARAFNYLWRYSDNLKHLYETPTLLSDDAVAVEQRIGAACGILESVRASGRTLLTEAESKQVLVAYGIPVVDTRVAASEAEAVAAAEEIGFPVVAKLHSTTITHKTDVGGVRLNLADTVQVAEAFRSMRDAIAEHHGSEHFHGVTIQPMIVLRDGYELILGSTLDSQFGPIIMFGAGGQLVEVFRDSAVALPPVNATLARRLIEQTRISQALHGVRGRPPIDFGALCEVLVSFSRLVVEQPWLKECDINPLLAAPGELIALDARMVVHDAATPREAIPLPAIRPYPVEYVRSATLKDGTPVTVRPIRLEDEPLIALFHEGLSDMSVRRRYFHLMQLSSRVAHERLIRVCLTDYDRELAIVAVRTRDDGKSEILGVGRLSRERHSTTAEFAVTVSDAWQGRGLGRRLLESLIEVGRAEGVERIVGRIMADHWVMLNLCKQIGFELRYEVDEVRATLDLFRRGGAY